MGKTLAQKLGYRFIDTGLMYRAITWTALRDRIDPEDEARVTALAQKTQVEVALRDDMEGSRITVDGQDVTDELRSRTVESGVSLVSQFPGVRRAMVAQQRALAQQGNIVMAGRDIGTVVLPDAELKIFLTASPEERSRRRQRDMKVAGQSPPVAQVLEELTQRDRLDTQRADSPLRAGEDAHMVNTDHTDLNQVVQRILALMEDQ